MTAKQAQDQLLQPEIANDNGAIVSAISSMSDLLEGSPSSVKATMTKSFTEIQNTLAQFAVQDVEGLADLESLDDGQRIAKRTVN